VNVGQLTAAGLAIGTSGAVTNPLVTYDTTAKDSVTLAGANGAQIHKVIAGTVATDAVNVGQLTAAGLNIGTSGAVTNPLVTYDTTAKDSLTLAGANGAQIHKVIAGTAATDAVNVGQLTAAGLNIGTSGAVTNPLVTYDTTAKDSITLAGANGAQIHKVIAGSVDTDATNVAQLKALGATIGTSGTVTNAFVAYTDATKTAVSLGLGTVGAKITNLQNGAISAASRDAVNGSQLAAVASSAAAALGGGSTMGTDGKISAPTYTINNQAYTSLDSALTAAAASGSTGGGTDPLAVHYTDTNRTSVALTPIATELTADARELRPNASDWFAVAKELPPIANESVPVAFATAAVLAPKLTYLILPTTADRPSVAAFICATFTASVFATPASTPVNLTGAVAVPNGRNDQQWCSEQLVRGV
jgi:hypothetical protein